MPPAPDKELRERGIRFFSLWGRKEKSPGLWEKLFLNGSLIVSLKINQTDCDKNAFGENPGNGHVQGRVLKSLVWESGWEQRAGSKQAFIYSVSFLGLAGAVLGVFNPQVIQLSAESDTRGCCFWLTFKQPHRFGRVPGTARVLPWRHHFKFLQLLQSLARAAPQRPLKWLPPRRAVRTPVIST